MIVMFIPTLLKKGPGSFNATITFSEKDTRPTVTQQPTTCAFNRKYELEDRQYRDLGPTQDLLEMSPISRCGPSFGVALVNLGRKV